MSGGDGLREIRDALGMTRVELAELVGATRSAVHRWEEGDRAVPVSVLRYAGLVAWLREEHPSVWMEWRRDVDM